MSSIAIWTAGKQATPPAQPPLVASIGNLKTQMRRRRESTANKHRADVKLFEAARRRQAAEHCENCEPSIERRVEAASSCNFELGGAKAAASRRPACLLFLDVRAHAMVWHVRTSVELRTTKTCKICIFKVAAAQTRAARDFARENNQKVATIIEQLANLFAREELYFNEILKRVGERRKRRMQCDKNKFENAARRANATSKRDDAKRPPIDARSLRVASCAAAVNTCFETSRRLQYSASARSRVHVIVLRVFTRKNWPPKVAENIATCGSIARVSSGSPKTRISIAN